MNLFPSKISNSIILNRKEIFTITFLLFSFLFAGETGKISGKVIDKETSLPLVGVNVYIPESSFGSITDDNGEFYILNLPPETYQVTASYMGYKTELRTDVRVFIDKTTHVDYSLIKSIIEVDEVIVYSQRYDIIEPDLTSTKQSYRMDEMTSMPGMNDIDDVVNLQADVDGGHFRGGRSGEALYLIDGNSIVHPLYNSAALEPITLALKEVEVYTSGFSSEYGNVQSGVVNMVQQEGPEVEWQTFVEYSRSNDRYKTWGGSIYSKEYNQFFDMLNDPNVWAIQRDPISGVLLWTHFGIRFPENYMAPIDTIPGWPPQIIFPSYSDSLRTADLIRKLWLLSTREIGLEYEKPDQRFSMSTGGPLSEKNTFFMATSYNESWPFFASLNPNISAQLMTTLVHRVNNTTKIKLLANVEWEDQSVMTSNYYRWFDRTISVSSKKNRSNQISLGINKIIDRSSFFDIKINKFSTFDATAVPLLGDSTFSEIYSTNSNWRFYTAPTGYSVGKILTTDNNDETETTSLSSSYTNQLTNYHMLKMGLQGYLYDISVDYRSGRSNASSLRINNYNVHPYEGALYIQNKLEFEGMVANLGLRYDLYNLNTSYYKDTFSPYRNPNYDDSDPSKGDYYDKDLAAMEKTDLETVLQPRIGISFPVSDKAVFHLNYGIFTQRPPFNYIFGRRLKQVAIPDYELLGNPLLKPETTLAYDIGLIISLPFGLVLDLSSYLKDVNNLLQYAVYEDNGGNRYFRYDNREYADIKGFHLNLEKNVGWFNSYLRYNWESSKGKSASATGDGARAEYFESDDQEDILPDPEDIYLDYNRLHKLVGSVTFKTDSDFGFSIMDFHPLSDFSFSGIYRFSSGRPFTWDQSGQALQMSQRTPNEENLKVRMEKIFHINETNMKFYIEIFNVLNQKVFSYSRVFESSSNSFNPFIERYMLDRENITTDVNFEPFVTSLDGYLYSNQPRYYRMGLSFEF